VASCGAFDTFRAYWSAAFTFNLLGSAGLAGGCARSRNIPTGGSGSFLGRVAEGRSGLRGRKGREVAALIIPEDQRGEVVGFKKRSPRIGFS
jgi:hypothetical protein